LVKVQRQAENASRPSVTGTCDDSVTHHATSTQCAGLRAAGSKHLPDQECNTKSTAKLIAVQGIVFGLLS
jgi:hypothetical protein